MSTATANGANYKKINIFVGSKGPKRWDANSKFPHPKTGI